MRIAFSSLSSAAAVLALAALSCAATQPAARTLKLPAGGDLRYRTQANATALQWNGGRTLLLKRDATVSPNARLIELRLVAQPAKDVLIVADKYPSRPGGLSMCQAGEEEFLRVIVLKPAPKETFVQKLQSCRDNLELTDSGVNWQPDSSTLDLRWLDGKARTLKVAPNGQVSDAAGSPPPAAR